MKFLALSVLMSLSVIGNCQEQILLDESFDDWSDKITFVDPQGDATFGVDLRSIAIWNDDKNLYFKFEVGEEINLQEDYEITLYIDVDNNVNTGFDIEDIGADLYFNFGDRYGVYDKPGPNQTLGHEDIGLFSIPTVSSEQFEIIIARQGRFNATGLDIGSEIKFILRDQSGDDNLPDAGSHSYTLESSPTLELPSYSLEQVVSSDIRIVSYNVLQDGFFVSGQSTSVRKLVAEADADIYCFQEIYDHSAGDIADVMSNMLPVSGGQWFYEDVNPDIHILSKFPITDHVGIDGNGYFVLDLGDKEMLIINCHLACCGNNFERQNQADNIMNTIRNIMDDTGPLSLSPDSPILLVGDMNFVGLSQQPNTLITGDIQNNGLFGQDFLPDWGDGPLVDANVFATGLPTVTTWYDKWSSFFPGKLDYMIYTGSQIELKNGFTLYSEGLNQSEFEQWNINQDESELASDHLMVVGDFYGGLVTDVDNSLGQKPIVNIGPNPTEDHLIIDLDHIKESVLIKLMDTHGHLMQAWEVDELDVRLVHLDLHESIVSGTYFVLTESQHQSAITKFVVIR